MRALREFGEGKRGEPMSEVKVTREDREAAWSATWAARAAVAESFAREFLAGDVDELGVVFETELRVAKAIANARMDEREACVGALRTLSNHVDGAAQNALGYAAALIERGDHRKGT